MQRRHQRWPSNLELLRRLHIAAEIIEIEHDQGCVNMRAIKRVAIGLLLLSGATGVGAQGKEDAPAGVSPDEQPEFDRTRVFQPSELHEDRTATLVGQQPSFNVRATAAVGERMFTRYSYTVTTLARLSEPFQLSGPRGERHNVPTTENLFVPTIGYANSSNVAYGPYPNDWVCTEAQTYTRRNGDPALSCFHDKENDGRFDQVGRTYGREIIEIPTPVAYVIRPGIVTAINFRYELLYLGRSGGTLRVAYREYANELARPAFSTELTFDMAAQGDTVFRHRDLRVTVHQATNETITYTVASAN